MFSLLLKTSYIVAVIFFNVFAHSSELHSSKEISDFRVKSLFLYNFANYVEWPDEAFQRPTSPIRMCLYGNLPFGGFLKSVDGTLIGQRRLDIMLTQERRDIVNGCQLLFVSEDRKEELPDFFDHLKFVYILSVGDQAGFSDNGGVINILRTRDNFKFDINITNALQRGLFISSELLSLAKEVKQLSN